MPPAGAHGFAGWYPTSGSGSGTPATGRRVAGGVSPGRAPAGPAGASATGVTRWSQHTAWIPATFRASGTGSSRTSAPPASRMRSSGDTAGFFRWNGSTASVGGFSPVKNWCPQNSSLRSSFPFHCSDGPGVNSAASAFCAAAYSWMGARWSRIHSARPCVATSSALSRGWMVSSSTRTSGKLALSRRHVAPRSSDSRIPVSVPTYSTSGVRRSSVSVRTTSPRSPAAMERKVAP